MNEQLIVKNFGPIKDATVDFKRVTVFIGPTGGGKSTLAKLAAIFRSTNFLLDRNPTRNEVFDLYSIKNFFESSSFFCWEFKGEKIETDKSLLFTTPNFAKDISSEVAKKHISKIQLNSNESKAFTSVLSKTLDVQNGSASQEELLIEIKNIKDRFPNAFSQLFSFAEDTVKSNKTIEPKYFPSNRTFISSLEYSWAGLIRDDIGLPKDVLDFANSFSNSRKNIPELDILFLNAKYIHRNGQDFIQVSGIESLFRLYETASGIQSVTPLLVLLEHLSKNTEQVQSFIIEEPELNLFPLAQFELVKILVEKCAQTEGKNDLVLTTHSPYVLTALNLLCYAYRIAQQDEATAKKVAKLIPRHCWIDPDQFAAYYVDRPDTKRKQQVRSIINKKTGLIEENELDTASDELGAIFDKLVRLRKPTPTPSRAK